MTNSNCKFCESLQTHKNINKIINECDEEHYVEPLLHEYTVALVIRSWTKAKGKRRAGQTTDYRYRGIGYKLNYCPECGRAIKRKKRGYDG